MVQDNWSTGAGWQNKNMDISKLTREEKEKLYIEKMTELQLRWKNPIDSNWDFSDWTDEQLVSGLDNTIGQLRFEKLGTYLKYIIFLIIILVAVYFSR